MKFTNPCAVPGTFDWPVRDSVEFGVERAPSRPFWRGSF